MDGFIGTWKFEKCDQFEEYLKALGISAPLRKLALLTSPTVTIKQTAPGHSNSSHPNVWGGGGGEMRFLLHVFFFFTILLLDKYSLTTDATVRSVTIEFKFGQKVEETTVGKDVLLNFFSIFFSFFFRSENCKLCFYI